MEKTKERKDGARKAPCEGEEEAEARGKMKKRDFSLGLYKKPVFFINVFCIK